MKIIIFPILFANILAFANEPKRPCDPASSVQLMKFTDGKNPFHKVTVDNRTIVVGGPAEKYSDGMDHLAVQRGLLYCTPGIVDCLKKEKVKMSAEFNVSFDLNAAGEVAQASNFNFSWKTKVNDQLNRCLMKVWSATEYGLIIKETKKISMPVKIE
jgi:hypothetical protein